MTSVSLREGDDTIVDDSVWDLDVLKNLPQDFVGFEEELQEASANGNGGCVEVVSERGIGEEMGEGEAPGKH